MANFSVSRTSKHAGVFLRRKGEDARLSEGQLEPKYRLQRPRRVRRAKTEEKKLY